MWSIGPQATQFLCCLCRKQRNIWRNRQRNTWFTPFTKYGLNQELPKPTKKKQVMTEKPRFLSKTEAFKNPSTSRILHNWKNWWCCDLLWNIPSCRTTDPQHPQLFFSPWCSQLHANRHMIPAVTVAARAISPVWAPRLGGFSCR